MGKTRKTKKFAQVKRMLNPKDGRIKKNQEKLKEKEEKIVKSLKEKVNEGLEIRKMKADVYHFSQTLILFICIFHITRH